MPNNHHHKLLKLKIQKLGPVHYNLIPKMKYCNGVHIMRPANLKERSRFGPNLSNKIGPNLDRPFKLAVCII